MTTSKTNLETLLQSGYEFQLGSYLSDGWEIFRRGIWSFAGFTLLFFGIQFGMGLIPFIGTVGSLFISAPLSAGYILVAHHLDKKENPEFGIFFKGFDFWGPLVLLAIIQSVLLVSLLLPIMITGFGGFDKFLEYFTASPSERLLTDFSFQPGNWTFFMLLPLIYLSISWRWSSFFILFYRMSPLAALEASRKVITKRFFMFLLFYIIIGLVVLSGVILLFIGVFFTLSFFYCADYAAFARVTRLNETQEEDISEHLVA
jgi:hypothetical protein